MKVNDISLAAITDRVMTSTRDILARNGTTQSFGPEDALVDVGLTSLDLVNLMLAVEAEFDILIPPTMLSPANFKSAASVSGMVALVLGEGVRKVA